MSMKRVSEEKFLEQLTWVCEQAKFHGFWVQFSWHGEGSQIDVTATKPLQMRANCIGKRHEFIFTTSQRGSKKR